MFPLCGGSLWYDFEIPVILIPGHFVKEDKVAIHGPCAVSWISLFVFVFAIYLYERAKFGNMADSQNDTRMLIEWGIRQLLLSLRGFLFLMDSCFQNASTYTSLFDVIRVHVTHNFYASVMIYHESLA